MNNRTTKNDPANRYDEEHLSLFEQLRSLWQGWQDSNPRHAVLETAALPTELHPYNALNLVIVRKNGRFVEG